MLFNQLLKYPVFILLITGYFISLYSNISKGYTICIFKNITNLPCPSCGSTRAVLKLLEGQFYSSIMMNPFGFLTFLLFTIGSIWFLIDILKKKSTLLNFIKKKWDLKLKIFVFIVVVTNWIWNISKGI